MKRFLQELDLKQRDYIVHCDHQSTIDLNRNTMYHARTKHIDQGLSTIFTGKGDMGQGPST